MDLAALKTELTTDPEGLGYTGHDEHDAGLLNAPTRTPDRESIDSGLLVACISPTDFAALTANQKQYLGLFTNAGSVPLTAAVKQNLAGMFDAGSATRQALVAAMKRTGSRAEELGLGQVTTSIVANARRE